MDTSQGIYWIAATLYWMELTFTFLIGTLAALGSLTFWMLNGNSPFLRRIEGVLPLKGRWLRYLMAALLFPLALTVPAFACLLLALIPPEPGFCVLTGALLILLCRAALRSPASLAPERTRLS